MIAEEDNIVDNIDLKLKIERLNECLNSLGPRDRQIIDMRYGLGKQKELTQREVAEILGISRSYVSRIEKKALAKLGKNFEQPDE